MSIFRRRPKRALGLRRGPRAPRARKAGLIGSGDIPSGYADLTDYATPVADQGEVGSCVAHGVPGAVCTTLAAAGTPLGCVPSVRHLYQLCLRLDRAADYPLATVQELPPLKDAGTRLSTCVAAMTGYGLVAGGSNCQSVRDATSDAAFRLAEVIRARRTIVVGGYSIASLREAMISLDKGRSLAIGGWWDSRSFDLGPRSAPMGAMSLDDPFGGGHCVEVLGYDARTADRRWLVKNSWGAGWGQQGFMWATDAFMLQQWDIWILDVVVRKP